MAAVVWGRTQWSESSQPGNLVLEQNSLFFVFSLGLLFFLIFWGRGLDPTLLKFETVLFEYCLTGEADSQ